MHYIVLHCYYFRTLYYKCSDHHTFLFQTFALCPLQKNQIMTSKACGLLPHPSGLNTDLLSFPQASAQSLLPSRSFPAQGICTGFHIPTSNSTPGNGTYRLSPMSTQGPVQGSETSHHMKMPSDTSF